MLDRYSTVIQSYGYTFDRQQCGKFVWEICEQMLCIMYTNILVQVDLLDLKVMHRTKSVVGLELLMVCKYTILPLTLVMLVFIKCGSFLCQDQTTFHARHKNNILVFHSCGYSQPFLCRSSVTSEWSSKGGFSWMNLACFNSQKLPYQAWNVAKNRRGSPTMCIDGLICGVMGASLFECRKVTFCKRFSLSRNNVDASCTNAKVIWCK
jgi:hypothetical protein